MEVFLSIFYILANGIFRWQLLLFSTTRMSSTLPFINCLFDGRLIQSLHPNSELYEWSMCFSSFQSTKSFFFLTWINHKYKNKNWLDTLFFTYKFFMNFIKALHAFLVFLVTSTFIIFAIKFLLMYYFGVCWVYYFF